MHPPTTTTTADEPLLPTAAPTTTTAPRRTTARKTLYVLGALSLLPLLLFLYSSFSPLREVPGRPADVVVVVVVPSTSTPTLTPTSTLLLALDGSEVLPVPSPTAAPVDAGTDPLRRDPDGYVLDPAWDVDAPPTTRYYNFTLTEVVGSPDGVTRTLLLLNSQFPGPLVRANTNDTLHITLHNRSQNSTSLHWHGQHQRGTPWMDGTVGVTSCPIPPGASFTYVFTVTHTQGTYWYHAHFSTTRIDGVFGPLIIHGRDEPAVDSDRVVMVQDYYHDLSAALLPEYLAPDNENAEPVPDGALINGRGVVDCAKVDKARYACDEAKSGGMPYVGLQRGGLHRLRFINVGAFAEFDIEIDNHEFTLIEADGTALDPYPLHRFRINVAQRYSILLRATDPSSASTFWLRARMIAHCFATIPATLETEARAILYYHDHDHDASTPPSALPTTTPRNEAMDLECKDLDTTELAPSPPQQAPPPTMLVRLRSNFEIGAYALARGFFNSTSWRPSAAPTLLTAVAGLRGGPRNGTFAADERGVVVAGAFDTARQLVVRTDNNNDDGGGGGAAVVDVLIDNFDDGNHPFHLHGHRFFVLAQGRGYFDMSRYPGGLDVANPLRRDTVTVEAYGWVLLRFVADNPGVWALHCHIAWHAEAGMLMQFLAGAAEVGGWAVPEQVREVCGRPERQRGGGIPDEAFMHD